MLEIVLVVVGVGIESVGLYCLKEYADTHHKSYLILGILLYVVVALMFVALLKQRNLGLTNGLWNVLSTVMVVIVGYFAFKEELSIKEVIGIILGIFSLVLLF